MTLGETALGHRRFLVIGLVLVAALGLLLQACSGAKSEALAVGGPALQFSLPAVDGQTVSLANLIGKHDVLLYFNMGYG